MSFRPPEDTATQGMNAGFSFLLDTIERQFAAFYGFDLLTHANRHLVSLGELTSNQLKALEETTKLDRAGILCDENSDGELFLGIYFSDPLKEGLNSLPSPDNWTISHLDAFLVAIEELSHFHLIVNRALSHRQVNILELECQAEVDKFIFSALNTCHHLEQSHLQHLFNILFDQFSIIKGREELYKAANSYAARFVQKLLSQSDAPRHIFLQNDIRELARAFYHSSWQDKHYIVVQSGNNRSAA